MLQSFDLYKVFFITAQCGSITAAAKKLFVTQPTVTHSIHILERELNCQLFMRGKKGVTLTPEGCILYKHVEIAWKELQLAEIELDKLKKFETGEIIIGANETTLHHFLLPYLKVYKEKCYNIYMKIKNGNTLDMIQEILDNNIDCGVLVCPQDFYRDKLTTYPLKRFNNIFVAGKAYAELSKSVLSINEILEYPIIGLSKNTMSNIIFTEFFANYNLDFKPDIELETSDLIVPAVENNLGIGIVPEFLAEKALKNNDIVLIQSNLQLPKNEITLIYKSDFPSSPAFKAFIECILSPIV